MTTKELDDWGIGRIVKCIDYKSNEPYAQYEIQINVDEHGTVFRGERHKGYGECDIWSEWNYDILGDLI